MDETLSVRLASTSTIVYAARLFVIIQVRANRFSDYHSRDSPYEIQCCEAGRMFQNCLIRISTASPLADQLDDDLHPSPGEHQHHAHQPSPQDHPDVQRSAHLSAPSAALANRLPAPRARRRTTARRRRC